MGNFSHAEAQRRGGEYKIESPIGISLCSLRLCGCLTRRKGLALLNPYALTNKATGKCARAAPMDNVSVACKDC